MQNHNLFKKITITTSLLLFPQFVLADCDQLCENSIALFSTPISYDMRINNLKNGDSAVYVTWTSKSNSKLPPLEYKGIVHAKLLKTKIGKAQMPTVHDACNMSIVLIESVSNIAKNYKVKMRNVLCDEGGKTSL